VCPWLLRELVDRKLWNDDMKNKIIAHNGSVQNLPDIPRDVKAIYKTVWEISQKKVLDLAADRGAFICQSQSLNVHLSSPTVGQLTSMHFYGWKKGLKTGMYYLRTRPAAQAIQFTVDHSLVKEVREQKAAASAATPVPSQSGPAAKAFQPRTIVKVDMPPPTYEEAEKGPTTSESESTPVTTMTPDPEDPYAGLSEQQRAAAEADPGFAEALRRKKEKELEQAKLMCSLENKEACVMCSG
jgi:ribonucleoside-diphosphate reductase subunit M1